MHIYPWQMDPPLQHRCLAYHYTRLGTSHFLLSSFSIVNLQLTICMQVKCSFSIIVIFHLQLSSHCNWLPSWLNPLYNIPSWATFLVLWSSGNFCNISQNMLSKAQVASQHWNTNKVVWTCKDDWRPQRTSTYKRPFTREGNYLVCSCQGLCTALHLDIKVEQEALLLTS